MKKFNRIFSLALVLALLVSCLPTVFAAETKANFTVDEEEVIVADWLWGSVMEERGAETIMKEYAETGFTDIYLLLKGTAGSTSWNSSVAGSYNSYSYDLLQTALDAAKPYGIRIHAWMMAARDDRYVTNNPGSNYYHFRVGTTDQVNQYVNLRDPGYQKYFTDLVKELCAKYPDLAGIHLDTIRYGGLYYDWGADARNNLINNYGMTKAEWNAATKAMCVSAGYNYTTNSDGYVVYASGSAASGTSFASALTGSGSTDAQNGAKKFLKMRVDTVNNFCKMVADAAPGKIITTAIMPETANNNVYEECVYGQQPTSMCKYVDYICVMSYASTYGAAATWPVSLSKTIINAGGNAVAAIQYFPNEDGSGGGPSNSRIYEEISNVMKYRAEVNNDTSASTGKMLGYASFRFGFGVYAAVEVVDENTLRITAMNQLHTSPVTKLVLNMKNGVKISNATNKSGWGSASFSFTNSGATLTISGSFLNSKGVSSFEVDYTGTVDEALGACLMSASTSSGELYTICNTIMQRGCKHEYAKEVITAATCTAAGQVKYTCGLCGDSYTETVAALGHKYEASYDEATMTTTFTCANCGHSYDSSCNGGHAKVETWALSDKTHFTFCYNCESGYSEDCHFVETARTEATCTQNGTITYTCAGTVGGVHDAYSGMGCGNTYTETIPASHSYGSSVDNGDGTHAATCSKCGEKVTEKHTEKVLDGKAATCTETGLTEGKVCTTCNATIVAQTVIPATGHNEKTTAATPATCTENGMTEGKVCATCGEVLVAAQIIPATGHTEVKVPGTPATCTADGVSDSIYCNICAEVIQAATKIPATGHKITYIYEDEDGHIEECTVCYYSTYEAHKFENGTCPCGATDGTAAQPTVDTAIKFNHTLNLASDISVNFAIAKNLLTGYDMNTAYVECTMNTYNGNNVTGKTTVKLYPVLNGNYYYFTFSGINATQMNDSITAVFYGTKNGVPFYSNNDVYSVGTYAYSQMNKTTSDATLKTLCADLLRYGASAQTYKGYRTNALVNANMTAAQKAMMSDINAVKFDNINSTSADIAGATVTWAGKALALDSKVTIKYIVDLSKYTGNINALTLRVSYTDISGQNKTATLSNPVVYNAAKGQYSFEFDGLLAAELRTTVSAAVYSGSTRMSSVLQYSASTYGNNKTGVLLDLCKALMAYSDSALAYFK